MADKLNGRLEVVKIEEPLSATDNCNYGELLRDKREVTVRNALPYEGRSCLVRFDLRDGLHRQEPEGYFISSVVPPSFEGLAPEQYVLVGLWEKDSSSPETPSFQDIEKVYQPRNMPFCRYFGKGSSIKKSLYIAKNEASQEHDHITIPRYVRRIDCRRVARIFIVESEIDLEKIVAAIRNQKLHPILMEPLKPFHQNL